jgi:sugar phosphate isomerase/epimerase
MNIDDFGVDTITFSGSLEVKLAAMHDAGFTQVMLSARDLAGHPDGPAAAIAAVKASGLRVTGLQVLRDFEGLSGHLHAYKMDMARAMLDMCRAVGSRLLLVCSTTSAHASGDTEAAVRDLQKLATLAIPYNIRIAYEGLSWGKFVNQYPQAWDIVDRANLSNLGLAIDSFHILAAQTALDDLELVSPSKIFFVQLSDFMWRETPSSAERMDTARHFRVFPGEGVHSERILELVRLLDAIGYSGDYSFEVFNDDYVQLPQSVVAARARQSVRWLARHVSSHSLPLARQRGQESG